jgi:hypothetical protein
VHPENGKDRQTHDPQGLPGAPHGMCTTLKDRVNADLPGFLNQKEQRKQKAA